MKAYNSWGKGLDTAFLNTYQTTPVFMLRTQPRYPLTHFHSNKMIRCSLMSCVGKISRLQVDISFLSVCSQTLQFPWGSLLTPSSPHTFSLISSAFMVLTDTYAESSDLYISLKNAPELQSQVSTCLLDGLHTQRVYRELVFSHIYSPNLLF